MKKIIYFIILIFTLTFIESVYAANYKESEWFKEKENCKEFSEVSKGYTDYTFDTKTGKFSLDGQSYTVNQKSNDKKYIFYTISQDGYTIYAYIPSYNSNYDLLKSLIKVPKDNCDKTYKLSKKAILYDEEKITKKSELNNKNHQENNNNLTTATGGKTLTKNTNQKNDLNNSYVYLIPLSLIIMTILLFKRKDKVI